MMAAVNGIPMGCSQHKNVRKVIYVPVDRLRPKVYVRKVLGGVDRLVESIKRYGVLVPLLVSESESGDYYEIVCGYRRYVAAIEAGLSELPVMLIGKVSISEALKMIWEEDELKKRFTVDERCMLIAALVEDYGLRRVSRELSYPVSTVETMAMAGKTFAGVWKLVRSSNTSSSQDIKVKVKVKLAEEVCRAVLGAGYKGREFKELAGRIYLTLVDFPTSVSIEILREWAKKQTLEHLEELVTEFRENAAFMRPVFRIPNLEERVPVEFDGDKPLERLLVDAARDHGVSYDIVGQVSIGIIEFSGRYAGISSILCPRCGKPTKCRVCGSIVNCLCAYPHSSVRNRRYRYLDAEGSHG